MTLLAWLTAETVLFAVLWLCAVGAPAVAVAAVARHLGHPLKAQIGIGAAGAGGALFVAALAERLGAPEPLRVMIGPRPLPVMWVVVGVAIGVGVRWSAMRREPRALTPAQ